jgi:RNA polymerase sigma-70 factor (ECF subfamily)
MSAADDLELANACTRGDATALEHLQATIRRLGHECGAKLNLSSTEREEAVQRLLTRLLTGEAPALASYDGRGPLTAWLRVCITREALMLRRSETRHESEELDLGAAIEPLFDPELQLLAAEGRTAVKAAFQAAFDGLRPRDKMLLAYQLVDQLPVREIGRILGIDGSNVSRRLAKIRTDLLAETRRSLSTVRGLGETSIDDVLSMLDSQLDLSVSRLLHAARTRS